MRSCRLPTGSPPGGSVWVRKWRGSRGWLGTSWSATAGISTASALTIAVGRWRWYSSDMSEEKPSWPISSSAYRPPSGLRNWVWRLRGTSPTERENGIGPPPPLRSILVRCKITGLSQRRRRDPPYRTFRCALATMETVVAVLWAAVGGAHEFP